MRFAVPQLHAMQKEFADKMRFLCVYIAEAHAADEWYYNIIHEMIFIHSCRPISSARASITGETINFKQPVSNEQRMGLANRFVNDYKFEIETVIDLIDNPFESMY